MSFKLDGAVLAEPGEVEHEWFPPLDLGGLAAVVPPRPPHEKASLIEDRGLRRVYLDALLDLHPLIEEFRFHAILAFALLRDYRAKHPTPSGSEEDEHKRPIPAEALVVLQRYSREPPSPADLFENPHQEMAGFRVLSRWVAGQLLDSALFRGIAACDRLAILLQCRAGVPIRTNRLGQTIAPSFTVSSLEPLAATYGSQEEWRALFDFAADEEGLLRFVKEMRNGFTHRRRVASELHGEVPVIYEGLTEHESIEPVLAAQDHWALAPAFYNHVLRPALEATRSLVRPAPSTR